MHSGVGCEINSVHEREKTKKVGEGDRRSPKAFRRTLEGNSTNLNLRYATRPSKL